ncbi:MAG: DUF1858 domain-containing protein [Candidatus Obscuribacterales bacterium]|nr:DUF1858 domain-containing protein [Candidatus Obscuribacterales bacterium]
MNADTRLSEALKAGPAVLDYIISLNPHDFERLRNPLLNKVMPPRITLGRIAAMVNMPVAELIAKIHELSGLPAESAQIIETRELPHSAKEPPLWLSNVDLDKIKWVDVTPIDAELGDPMPPINIAVNTSKPGDIVGIKHMWEPQPLYDIWHGRGLQFWSKQVSPDLWHVFVYRPE